MEHRAFASNKTFDETFATSGKFVGGSVSFATGAVTWHDETGIDDGADERNAFVDGLSVDFVRMKGEFEALKILVDNGNVTHELRLLGHRNDNVKVVDVATVMSITEVESDEAVELIEIDIGEELTGEIADDDTVTGLAVEEAFVVGEGGPIFAGTADGDAVHWIVVDDLAPEELGGLVEFITIVGVTEDLILGEVIEGKGIGINVALELTI